MSKRVVKKRKIKLRNFMIFLLIIIGFIFGVVLIVNLPINNILIKNTDYLNDDYVLELAKIKDYPSFVLTNSYKVKNRLKKSPYINDCNVKKKFFNVIEINIKEEQPVFYNKNNNEYVFGSGNTIKDDTVNNSFRVPRLNNYVPDKKYKTFVKAMSKINVDVLGKMSDIEYVPNDFDKDRFVVYMDDGNMVYLTLTKFKQINYYNDVVSQLEGRHGILYLDSGNHFEIKE